MTSRHLAAIAVAGYLAFAIAFKFNWRAPEDWDRVNLDALSARAAGLARDVAGLDVTNWSRISSPRVDHPLELWRKQHAHKPEDELLTPLHIAFAFQDPYSSAGVEVMMMPDGRPRSIRMFGPNRQHPEVQDLDQRARRLLNVLAGSFAPRFELEDGKPNDRGERFRWTAPGSDPSLGWRVSVNLERGRFHTATLEPVFKGPRSIGLFLDGQGYDTLRGLAMATAVVWAAFAFVSGWARRVVDHRLAFTAAAAFVIFELAGRLSAGGHLAGLAWAGLLPVGAAVAVLTGAGRIAASSHEWPRWQAFVLFLRFRWRARSVGASVLAGLAWSGAIAALPFLIAGLFPHSALRVATYGGPTLARWPLLASAAPLLENGVYGLFVFFAPLVFRRWSVTRTALLLLGAVVAAGLFATANPFSAGTGASLISAVCAAALMTGVYYIHGLLAILVAFKGAMVLTAVAGLFTAGMSVSAVLLLALLAASAAGSAWVARNGRDIELQDDRNITGAYLSAREKLKAEFSLAHRAQQNMLPAAPPPLEGFTLAAACQPARDVGGDLYDYFPLPDGRLGICVADVSGKGMSAALYMTLTKGVLAAASPECRGLAELSSDLNRHLYAAGKRKVFVTAVLAAVDAPARTVEFVRAGHNPILLRSAASGAARYLPAKGLGLGMTGGPLFARATSVERVTLDPGDSLVLYSDGVTEAMNTALEQYGEDRLRQVVERHGASGAAPLLASIREDIAGFTGAEPAHDDITILVLQAVADGQKVTIST